MNKLLQLKHTANMIRSWKKSKPNNIWYVGGFPNIENLGDVALHAAYLKIFNNHTFNHFTGGRINSTAVNLFNLYSPAILSGGTLINRLSYNTTKDAISLFPNFFVFGTGVAQTSFWNRVDGFQDMTKEWCELLKEAKYLGVRGPLSQKHLQDAGLQDTQIIGDPVLIFTPKNFIEYEKKEKSIGINIGVSGENVWGTEDQILKDYIKLVSSLKSSGHEIHWFVVCPEDLEITKSAAKATATTQNIHIIYSDYEHYFNIVSQMNSFIGLKLHAVVMAICRFVPSIMIEYRPKCLDFMLSINEGENNYRSDKININEIIDKINLWSSNSATQEKKLYDNVSLLTTKQLETAKKLLT